jgi:hypothetical protein
MFYLLMEDGFRLLLEDLTGAILLDDAADFVSGLCKPVLMRRRRM